MPASTANHRLLTHLRRVALPRDGGTLTDGQLLGEFVRVRDEAAFAALVRRHGPMVLGVCRRVVGDWHLAEDAFQAVFLVLARRAAAVRPREQVGNWLYGVAHRTARKARANLIRRRSKEKQVATTLHPEVLPGEVWHDLQPILDAELAALPDRLRLPLVLCDLEGRTQREVARQLDLPPATLANRLAAARRALAKRLTARGITLSTAALAVALAAPAVRAAVPTALANATLQTASALATDGLAAGVVSESVVRLSEEVIRMMLLSKLKMVLGSVLAVVLLLGGLGAGTLPGLLADEKNAGAGVPAAALNADQPGPKLDDATYLRRISLDLRGSLPSVVEVRYFIADKDRAKRTKVVEWMLRDVKSAEVGLYYLVPQVDATLEIAPEMVRQHSFWKYRHQPAKTKWEAVRGQPTDVVWEIEAQYPSRAVTNEAYLDRQLEHAWIDLDLPLQVEDKTHADAVRYWLAAVEKDETDDEFLRRACQEARGTAPTTIELEYFKADKDAKKREKLLDSLLKDPAVAKKVGEGWKDRMLYRRINLNTLRYTLRQERLPVDVRHQYGDWVYRLPTRPNRFGNLLDQLLDGKRTNEQVFDALSLAALGRLPTESEKQLALASVTKQQDKRAAWSEVLTSLAGTSEAKQHADELQRRGTTPKKK